MTTKYYWCDKDQTVLLDAIKIEWMYCVDTDYKEGFSRYGMYKDRDMGQDWVHIPKSEFPKAFLAHLLLLNIT